MVVGDIKQTSLNHFTEHIVQVQSIRVEKNYRSKITSSQNRGSVG